jgi:hypothetical protein
MNKIQAYFIQTVILQLYICMLGSLGFWYMICQNYLGTENPKLSSFGSLYQKIGGRQIL